MLTFVFFLVTLPCVFSNTRTPILVLHGFMGGEIRGNIGDAKHTIPSGNCKCDDSDNLCETNDLENGQKWCWTHFCGAEYTVLGGHWDYCLPSEERTPDPRIYKDCQDLTFTYYRRDNIALWPPYGEGSFFSLVQNFIDPIDCLLGEGCDSCWTAMMQKVIREDGTYGPRKGVTTGVYKPFTYECYADQFNPFDPSGTSQAFGALRNMLVDNGWTDDGTDGVDLIHACYDWTSTTPGFPEFDRYKEDLISQVESLYESNDNSSVTFIAHSLGGVVLMDVLKHHTTLKWRKEHIRQIVTVNTPYRGSHETMGQFIEAIPASISGIPVVGPIDDVISNIFATFASIFSLFPWYGDDVVAITYDGEDYNATPAEIKRYFKDQGYLDKPGKGPVAKHILDKLIEADGITWTSNPASFHPGVPTHILYSEYSEASDRKSTRLNSSHVEESRMPSSA